MGTPVGNQQDAKELEMGVVRCEHKQIVVDVRGRQSPSRASVKPLSVLRASELAVTSQESGQLNVSTE